MGFNLPFNVPVPRRFLILFLCIAIIILFLHTFAPTTLPPALTPGLPHHEPDASLFSPSKWLPPILNSDAPDHPLEFDEEGNCLFLSPFDALSAREKERATALVLERVSAGIVKSPQEYMGGDDGEIDGFGNMTDGAGTMEGMTHPILGLLRDGETKWNDMVAKQSKTLAQAVDVYKERWGRQPPKGFDKWYVNYRSTLSMLILRWHFAQTHDVFLPDEYDA
jgi:beta-1,2-xylosyltransferase